jgi:hypothetical protein
MPQVVSQVVSAVAKLAIVKAAVALAEEVVMNMLLYSSRSRDHYSTCFHRHPY